MTRKLFGTDGIRGKANREPMTAETALRLALAAGAYFRRGDHRHRVVIGKDTRLSGYMLEAALMSGFTSVGMDVFLLGPMPTPAISMLTRSLRADLGVMISASHNRFDDNGIKLFDPDGFKLSDDTERRIEELIEQDSASLLVPSDRIGRATRVESAQERYIEFAKRTLPRNLRLDGLRIVIDCANGAAYKVAPEALWELGAEVVKIGVDPNGRNINHKCGSTAPEALIEKVKEVRADIGIALDGDADRVVLVDEKGHIVDGDQLMAVIAESWHRRGKLAAGGIVATVMSNLGLERAIEAAGGKLVRTQVGAEEIALLVVMAAVQFALPYVLFTRGIAHVPGAEASLIALIEPVLNPVWVALFYGEDPSTATIIGGAVILVGLVVRYAIFREPADAVEVGVADSAGVTESGETEGSPL